MKMAQRVLVGIALLVQMHVVCLGQTIPLSPLVDSQYLTNFVRAELYGETMRNGGTVFFGQDASPSQRGLVSMLEQNIGKDDFTGRVRFYVPPTISFATPTLFTITSSSGGTVGANSFFAYATSAGALIVRLTGNSSTDYRQGTVTNFVSVYGGRVIDLTLVRVTASPGLAIYVNGVSAVYGESTGGTPPSWAGDVVGPYLHIGNQQNTPWVDRLFEVQLYNIALSTDEARILTMYGAQALHRSARLVNKIKNVSKNADFSASGGNWVGVAGGTISYDGVGVELDITAATNGDGLKLPSGSAAALRVGVLHRLEFEIRNSSAISRTVKWGATTIATVAAGNGKYWIEFSPTVAAADLEISGNAGNWSLAAVRLSEVGSVDASMSLVSNGGFDEPGAGPPTFLGWFDSVSGVTAISKETSAANVLTLGTGSAGTAGASAAKIVIDGSGNAGTLITPAAVFSGQKYRLKYWSKADSTANTPQIVASGSQLLATNAVTTSWTQTVIDFIAAGPGFGFSPTVVLSTKGGAGRTVWIDNVELQPLGVTTDINLSQGIEYQAADKSVSGTHALLSGVKPMTAARRGVVRGRTTTNGNEQLCGGVILPVNGRIANVLITSSGSATINLGTASGGSQIASSVSIASGKNEVGTFVTRYSSNGQFWVNSNAGVTLDFTVLYDLVD